MPELQKNLLLRPQIFLLDAGHLAVVISEQYIRVPGLKSHFASSVVSTRPSTEDLLSDYRFAFTSKISLLACPFVLPPFLVRHFVVLNYSLAANGEIDFPRFETKK